MKKISENKKWELNFLGKEWQFEGETEEIAEAKYLGQIGYPDKQKYEKYCESIGVNPELIWIEVK